MELLSTAQVLARTRVPRSTFFFWRKRGEFPAPLRVPGSRLVVWRSDVVDGWLRQRGIVCPAHCEP